MANSNVANTKIVPIETKVNPYYDDFEEKKNFHKILFRPGYAIQGRELTQLQTILQNQIERFGNHIFKNGSLVTGGQISVDTVAQTLNLYAQYGGSDIDVSKFQDKIVTYASGNNKVRAYCVGYSANTVNAAPSITVKYLTGDEFIAGDSIISSNGVYANISPSSANTQAVLASISDGIFFINGYFVKTPKQTIVVSKHTIQANAKVGLEFDDSIITEGEDTSLLDPAQEATNYQAPGATRYKIELNLKTRELDTEDEEKFIELIRFENGVVKKQIKYPIYSDLENTLARRTFDESGSYTVRPFKITLKEHSSNANSIQAVIDPGKAYIQGYEFETLDQKTVDIPRARTTKSITNYDLSLNYGNYLYVNDIRGLPNISSMEIADVHIVPWQNVSNTAGGTPSGEQYRSTKLGTAKIRSLDYDSASNTANALTKNYRMYIFDTTFSNLSSNANVVTSNSITIYDSSGLKFSNVSGAYSGATLRFVSGLGAPATYTVNNYSVSGATKNLLFSSAFTTSPNNSTIISLEFNFNQAESLVIIPSGQSNTGASEEWYKFNISTSSKGGNANSPVSLSEPTLKSLVFPFPENFLKAGSIVNPNYQYIKVFPSVSFSAGVGTISIVDPDEAFNGGAGGSGISSSVITNYVIMVKNKGSSTVYTNGQILTPASISVSTGAGSSTATITLQDAETITATIFAKINLNNGVGISPKAKILYSANTTHFNPGSAASNGSFISNYSDISSNVTLYLNAGQVSIQTPTKVPGNELLLHTSDVKTIQKIYDLQGATLTPGMSISGYTDVKDRYNFDTGQKDTHYDFGKIKLNPGYVAPTGPLVVCFDWYEHTSGISDGLGYFSLDSYPNVSNTAGYAAIPSYTMENGKEIQLRDCIDFRPKRQNAQNSSPNYSFQGIRIPAPNENFSSSSYDYYLPRRDKIVLTKEKEFKLIGGVSDISPQESGAIVDSMELYKLLLPAYTLSASNVEVTFVENKRYTMRDIGLLETRIKNLEYYTTLSFLEKDASALLITDSNGLERVKYGILVDDFVGHSVGDVRNIDYDCSMDYEKGGMTARNKLESTKLYVHSNSNMKIVDQKAIINYTEEPFVSQGLATKIENVQPFMFAIFSGTAKLWPDADLWIDYKKAPVVVTNPNGVNDNHVNVPPKQNTDPHGGRKYIWVKQKKPKGLFGLRRKTIWTQVDVTPVQEKGGAVSATDDLSINPYIRTQNVSFVAHSLRPSRRIYYFFDGVDVSKYILKTNIVRLSSNVDFRDNFGTFDLITSGSNSATVLICNPSVDFSNNNLLYVSNVSGQIISGQIITGDKSAQTATVLEYHHFSGVAAAGGANSITLQAGASNTNSFYVGNTIYLVSGAGISQSGTIVQYNGATRVANVSTNWSIVPTTNTFYSIGNHFVNKDGSLAGTFVIPSNDTLKFRTGERLFRIIDVSTNIEKDCSTRADTRFVAQALTQITKDVTIASVPPKVSDLPRPTPVLKDNSPRTNNWIPQRKDPLAQTFYVDPLLYGSGVFISSVDLFFKTKDTVMPVTIQIRPVINGFPHSYEILKGSEVSVYPKNVKLSDSPSSSNSATSTTFTFSSPVYLKSGEEYALVVLSDSREYDIYVAELGQKIIGTDKIVSEQPYSGSLFKSQNGSTWTPTQLEDLMFVIRKCVFSTSSSTLIMNNATPSQNANTDLLYVQGYDEIFTNTSISYEYSKDYGSTYEQYDILTNSKQSSQFILSNLTPGQFKLRATLKTENKDISPILHTEKFDLFVVENIINNLSLSNSLVTFSNTGTGYSTEANISVSISGGGGLGANAYVSNVSSGKINSIIFDSAGSGYNAAPTITFTGGTAGTSATATISNELASSGGPGIAKYITRVVTLADGFNAGDLKVWLTAYKPKNTDILVYYKVRNSNDPERIENKNWMQMVQSTPSVYTFSLGETNTIEYAYSPFSTTKNISYQSGEATYDNFNQFLIKIVLKSSSTVILPIVYDMRTVALPGT